MKKNQVVIVDPYSSGALLPAAFRKKNIECIAVHTQDPSESAFSKSFIKSDFKHSLTATHESISSLGEKLNAENPLAILPGIDSGVTLADQLSTHLKLVATNTKDQQEARRNKDVMQACIAKAGLRHIKSDAIESYKQAEHWIKENTQLPVVIKPQNSGGSNGVKKCETLDDVKVAIESLIDQQNIFGLVNKQLVIQEFLEGDEFCVDSVSCQGTHYVTNVGKYFTEELKGSFVFKMIDYSYPLSGDISTTLTTYCKAALDALGIVYGASHCEIMLTNDGPVMIETGARMHGGKNPPLLVERCSNHALVDLVVDSYVDFESFKQRIKKPASYKAYGAGVFFINKKIGTVLSLPALETINKLPSLFAIDQFVNVGDEVTLTTDLYTSPLWVYIANDNLDQFKQDLSTLNHINNKQLLLETV